MESFIKIKGEIMISSLEFELYGEIEQNRNDLLGGLLQGFIMENIDSSYAKKLHESNLHPYSQYILRDGEKLIWILNTFNIEAKDKLAEVIKKKDSIYLRYKDKNFKINSCKEENLPYSEFVARYYLGEGKRKLNIKFLTPTSFKQNSKYVMFPSIRLMFQSLMMKFDTGSADMKIFDKQILRDFEDNIEISGYKLRTTSFHLEGVKIPSFIGEVSIVIRGAKELVNLANMLIAFGCYSGIGIKTSIGMGGMTFE